MTQQQKDKILGRAKKRLKEATLADAHNRIAGLNDLRFLNGGEEQWDEVERKNRAKKRPMLTINILPKFVNRLVGDIRQNTPSIKIRPIDDKASVDIADIRAGIIRNIEYFSNADMIYEDAFKMVASCGLGAWRILTRFITEESFEQEIYIDYIRNPFNVYLDPSGKKEWGFVIDRMKKEDFKAQYPSADFTAFADMAGGDNEMWWSEDSISKVEYWEMVKTIVSIVQLEDGNIIDEADYKTLPEEYRSPIVKQRKAEKVEIKQYILTGVDILKENQWAGEYIPIVLVEGRTLNIEGKQYRKSLIRDAIDPQKLLNYWHTLGAETIALAPKTPLMVTPKQVEGFEDDYKRANIENFPYLKFNPDPQFPGAPQRQYNTSMPSGIFTEIQMAESNIENTIGVSEAWLGKPSNERSGVAIAERRRGSDIGTYEFVNNLERAIIETGTIINDLIPHIYDTDRDVTVRKVDGSEHFVPINTTANGAMERIKSNPLRYGGMNLQKLRQSAMGDGAVGFNDISEGRYAVAITVGPSYATARLEAREEVGKLLQTSPDMFKIAGDLFIKNMDFKGADELAERLRKTIPPNLIEPREGEKPLPPPQPSPAEQIEAEKLNVEKMKIQLEMKKIQAEHPEAGGSSREDIRQTVMEVLQELMQGGQGGQPPLDNSGEMA